MRLKPLPLPCNGDRTRGHCCPCATQAETLVGCQHSARRLGRRQKSERNVPWQHSAHDHDRSKAVCAARKNHKQNQAHKQFFSTNRTTSQPRCASKTIVPSASSSACLTISGAISSTYTKNNDEGKQEKKRRSVSLKKIFFLPAHTVTLFDAHTKY